MMSLLLFMFFPSVSGAAVQDAVSGVQTSKPLEYVDSVLRSAVPEFPELPTANLYEWLRQSQSRGFLADVTGGLVGSTIEIERAGRPWGESKMCVMPVSQLRKSFDPIKPYRRVLGGDIILFLKADGSLVNAGVAVQDGDTLRINMPGRGLSAGTLPQYCTHWKNIAGIKVLRVIWNARPYNYTKSECMVPMRDGCRLYTAVYEPIGADHKPILMVRNPYGIGPYGYGGPGDLSEKIRFFTDRGYIIVEQNVRGTYMSEGKYENVRPLNGVCDEATDAYDTIDWLLTNTDSNGNVGIYGVSYPGFYATLAATCGHPALKIVSPQAPVADWWKGDDAHHNGAFMLSDIYGFGSSFFREKHNPTPEGMPSLIKCPKDSDIYSFFKGKSMRQVFRAFGDSLEFFSQMKAHPNYDDFWKDRNPVRHLSDIKPAVMVVGGLYDAEDGYGAVETYKALKGQKDKYFVSGPWTHGGWRNEPLYLEQVELPVFEYYLEGKGCKPSWKELYIPTGIAGEKVSQGPEGGRRMLYDLAACRYVRYNLKPGSYVSDPSDPVPYMDSLTPWRDKAYMWAPQNFLDGRTDVLSRTVQKPLKDTLWAFGEVRVHLKARVSGTDADFIVKLIDVAPDGTQSLVRADVMPARWRNSTETPEPLQPGRPFEIDFSMVDVCHCFAPGHSIMVQVQSSWFPLVAMNPQKFVKNPYIVSSKEYSVCRMNILRGSYIAIGTLR